jgi:hypothetical protein
LESVCGGNLTVGSNPTLSARSSPGLRPGNIRSGGLCNRRPRTPPGPEGSNGSGFPDVTQYPPGLALPRPALTRLLQALNEVPGYRPQIPAPGF